MKLLYLLAALGAGLGTFVLAFPCLWGRHDSMLTQKRDATGRVVKPHVLVWECRNCGKEVAETKLETQWSMVARIRRQAVSRAAERRRA